MTFCTQLVEGKVVSYADFDCGVTSYPEARKKVRQTKRERTNLSRSCEQPNCIPSNDQENCFFYEEQTSIISLNPYKL